MNITPTTPNDDIVRALDLEPESFGPDQLTEVGRRLATADESAEAFEGLFLEHDPEEFARDWLDLADFLESKEWQNWREEHESSLAINDPERYARIQAAAEHGEDGSTHYETIEDQRQAIVAADRDGLFPPHNADALLGELDHIESWHKLNDENQRLTAEVERLQNQAA